MRLRNLPPRCSKKLPQLHVLRPRPSARDRRHGPCRRQRARTSSGGNALHPRLPHDWEAAPRNQAGPRARPHPVGWLLHHATGRLRFPGCPEVPGKQNRDSARWLPSSRELRCRWEGRGRHSSPACGGFRPPVRLICGQRLFRRPVSGRISKYDYGSFLVSFLSKTPNRGELQYLELQVLTVAFVPASTLTRALNENELVDLL